MSAVEQAARVMTSLYADGVPSPASCSQALADAGLLITEEPSAAEVEAAALALHDESCGDDSCDGSDMGGFESDARAALLAARAVRLGVDHA